MIEIFDIMLLRPQWLLVVPLVAVVGYYFVPRVTALAGWDRAIDPALLAALERLGRVVPGSGRRNWFPAATAMLIAFALIGPANEVREGASFRNLDGLVVVMDLSRSVTESTRLGETLAAARQMIDQAGTRPVALVVYGGDAYLASAFTSDHRALGTTIAVLDSETIPDAGSRPERGLAFARRSLVDADIVAGDVVLVTDGGGLGDAAFREADAIARLGSRVSVVFAPSAEASTNSSPPDQGLVEALARSGGGRVADVLDPATIVALTDESASARLADGDFATLAWQDYGRFLLLLALIPALALFRRGG
ncbi:VWA domain-containing protein [Pelagibius sp. Alg239-R121]|uniref:vWA domain-containing protein n=1 Tax=Pelagibius sp. Alg239-R121 TaxID=2993448 RepID=UPI0024A73B86|nr:VWA domain-containing protein [Pelagibius sp. Alg239-R121]